MAYSELVPKVWRSVFLEEDRQTNIYRALMADYSADLAFGDTVYLPTDGTSYSAGSNLHSTLGNVDETNIDNLKWPNPELLTPSRVGITLDKLFAKTILVTHTQARRLTANTMDKGAREQARAFREQFNSDARAALNGITGDSQTTALSVATANFGEEAHRNMVIGAIRDMTETVDYAHWPLDNRYLVLSPAYMKILRDYVIAEKIPFVVSNVADEAFVRARIMEFDGWRLVADDSLDAGHATGDDDHHPMYFLQRGEGFSFIEELNITDIYTSREWFGDVFQIAQSYAVSAHQPSKIRVKKTTIT